MMKVPVELTREWSISERLDMFEDGVSDMRSAEACEMNDLPLTTQELPHEPCTAAKISAKSAGRSVIS